jgi:hypothetical protein
MTFIQTSEFSTSRLNEIGKPGAAGPVYRNLDVHRVADLS